jgi:hypothetical protein
LGSGLVTCSGNSNATLTVNGTLQSDNTNNPSSGVVYTTGNGSISADQINTASTQSNALQGKINPSTTPAQTGVSVPDPYAALTPPVTNLVANAAQIAAEGQQNPGQFQYQGYTIYGGTIVGPGIYASQVSFPNSTTTLSSGVYIFMNGLNLAGNSSQVLASATTGGTDGEGGVLLYIYRGQYADSGQGSAALAPFNYAPTSPAYTGAPSPWPGVVIWQDGLGGQGSSNPSDPTYDSGDSQPLQLSGNGATTSITGTVYAPVASVGPGGNGGLAVSSVVSSGMSCYGGGNGSGNFTIG